MARPSPTNQPTNLPSISVSTSSKSWFFFSLQFSFKKQTKKESPFQNQGPKARSPPTFLKPQVSSHPCEVSGGAPSIFKPHSFCFRTLMSTPRPHLLQFSEGSGMARDPESQSCLYYKYIYFFFYGTLGGQSRQGVRTEALPILLSPTSAPGPSPSLHRKQSGDTRFYTFLFFCCSLDLTWKQGIF